MSAHTTAAMTEELSKARATEESLREQLAAANGRAARAEAVHSVVWIEPGASAFVTFTCHCGAVVSRSGTVTIAGMLGEHIRAALSATDSGSADQ